jgi:FkbM family methyltransferase
MPGNQKEHWEYTVNEWTNDVFRKITDALPNDGIDVIYDIGANVGGWIEVIRRKYPEVFSYAFEPVKENFEALRENMAGKNTTCLNVAIYYGKEKARMMWRADGNIGAIFVEHVDAGEPKIIFGEGEDVTLAQLETLDLMKPDLIKMDVEGAEENIIPNSQIVKETKHLIIEWHPNTEPRAFFKEHLPNHKVVISLDEKQFYLSL